MPLSVDYIYWMFSSAAQSISAFVAFLLTGYALVHTIMDGAAERDDSLHEIHDALRVSYHKRLSVLAWLTGAGVLLSLVVVYVNRPTVPAPNWLVLLVALIDALAIIAGVWFVVSIIDPKKYQRAAKKALEDVTPILATGMERTSSAEFFEAFRHLERLVREYLRDLDLYIPSRGAPRMSFSFRQMADALFQNERIDRAFYSELLEINKYRNLVFHGHVDQADPGIVSRARAAAQRIEELIAGERASRQATRT
jgi:hypothetical protein